MGGQTPPEMEETADMKFGKNVTDLECAVLLSGRDFPLALFSMQRKWPESRGDWWKKKSIELLRKY